MIIKAIAGDWSYRMTGYTDINQLYINAVEQGNLAEIKLQSERTEENQESSDSGLMIYNMEIY